MRDLASPLVLKIFQCLGQEVMEDSLSHYLLLPEHFSSITSF
jgi:hypothetical protein